MANFKSTLNNIFNVLFLKILPKNFINLGKIANIKE